MEKSSSKQEAVIILLQHGLPLPTWFLWHKTDDLQRILKQGGLPSLPEIFVSNALENNRKIYHSFRRRKYQNKCWHNFEIDSENHEFQTPNEQSNWIKASKKAKKTDEIEKIMQNIPVLNFNSF